MEVEKREVWEMVVVWKPEAAQEREASRWTRDTDDSDSQPRTLSSTHAPHYSPTDSQHVVLVRLISSSYQ